MTLPVYMDYNATTPCDPRVVEAMLPYFSESFGNAASRSHSFGWKAAEAVDIARENVSRLINCEPEEIIFTSGATEAINLAIKGVFVNYASKGHHIITALTEHKAVSDTCEELEKQGAEITWLSVNEQGEISLDELRQAIRPTTILIALMYANNETGLIHPIREIGKIAREAGVIFFTDATQAVGKISVDVQQDHIDMACFSAHKFYGPKGVGGIFIKRKQPRVRPKPLIHGGGHEKGFRSGTLNVPGIVGLGKAAEIFLKDGVGESKKIQQLRDQLETSLMEIEGVAINGSRTSRLPHVTNLSFSHADSEAMMMGLNKYLALSSGSACTSASLEPSHVLKAMGLSREMAHSSLRFSLGRFTTEEEVNFAIASVKKQYEALTQLNKI